MTTLKKQTVSGIKWLVGSSFLQKTISVGTTVVLARILGPKDFGLFALALVVIDTLGLFKTLGFDSALIRIKDNVDRAANTAFLIFPFLGISLYIILAVSAPFIGKFLNSPELANIINVLGVIFIFNCLGRVPAVLLEKRLQFKKVSLIEITCQLTFSLVAIILALRGKGVWSLAIGYIAKTIVYNTLMWIYGKWPLRFEFDKKIAVEMFQFGKFLLLSTIVWFLRMNLDNVLVGKILGVAALGLYAIAFNIANFSAEYFGGKVYRVTYPAYSKLQENMKDLKEAFLKVFKHIVLIALPLGTLFLLLPGELIRCIFGTKWIEATQVLRALSFAGIFNTLSGGLGGIFLACNRPRVTFFTTVLQVGIFIILIFPMAKLFGITGVGVVVSVASFIAFLVMLFLTMKLLSIDLHKLYLNIRTTLFSTLFMGLGILLFKNYWGYYNSPNLFYVNFSLTIIIAAILFICSVLIFDKQLFNEIKALLKT